MERSATHRLALLALLRRRLDHALYGQVKVLRERKVALVVRRDGHDGARAVASEHVVGDPDRHLLAGERVDGEGAGRGAGLALLGAGGGAVEVALAGGGHEVLLNTLLVLIRCNLVDERMLLGLGLGFGLGLGLGFGFGLGLGFGLGFRLKLGLPPSVAISLANGCSLRSLMDLTLDSPAPAQRRSLPSRCRAAS